MDEYKKAYDFYDSCDTFKEWWDGTEEDWQSAAAIGIIFLIFCITIIGVLICG